MNEITNRKLIKYEPTVPLNRKTFSTNFVSYM